MRPAEERWQPDHDGALDCTPGAGAGERALAAAPLHCDPSSARPRRGAWKAPIIAAFSWPPRAISIRLDLNCSSAQHSAMPRSGNCKTRQQEVAAGKVGTGRQAGQDPDSSPPAFPSPPGPAPLRGSIGMAFSRDLAFSAPTAAPAPSCGAESSFHRQPLVFPIAGNKPSSGKIKLAVRSSLYFLFFWPSLAWLDDDDDVSRRAALAVLIAMPAYLSAAPVCCATCSSSSLVAPAMGMWMYVSGNRRGGRLLVLLFIGGSLALVLPGIGGGWL